MGKLKQINIKIDSKGRFCLPPKIRKALGNNPTLKKTPEGYLIISSKQNDFLEEFRKVITSKPHRTGKPTFLSPEEMKSIWETTKR
jgi:bifunctional DNA-binding transcriptional regulator/antitoxin component of YhaV-PrlF toxin-antitoxin module